MRPLPIWTITILGILIVSSCTKKVHCDAVEEDNPLLSITLFPKEGNSYKFISTSDTLELITQKIPFSQPYIAYCNRWHPLEDCHCETSYTQIYRNEGSKFLSEIWLSYSKDRPKAYRFQYSIQINRSLFYGAIDFQSTDLARQINDLLTEEILLGDKSYFNVLVIEDYHDYTEAALTAIIEPTEGLIGFTLNDDLYQLVD